MNAHSPSKPFTSFAAGFLALVGIVHLLRALAGWTLVIQDWPVPMWWSYAVSIPLVWLAIMVARERSR